MENLSLLKIPVFSIFGLCILVISILNMLSNKKAELQDRYPISELGIFGSYARGDQNSNSDIDILVDFNDHIGIRFIKLAHELEDLFNQKIDLVSRRAIKPRYLPFVEKSLIHV